MLFNSFRFLGIFLPIVLMGYWLVRRWDSRLALLWLAGASYFFYVAGEATYPWLILVSIAFNYLIGVLIGRAKRGRKALLILGLVGNLGALGYLKYFNFAAGVLHSAVGLPLPAKAVILPLGISFFTFTQIAYLVDVYRDVVTDSNPLSYFLFVTFFPHLIAGPILHHKEMMPQFARRERGRFWDDFGAGLAMFAIGLFKKTVIADAMAPIASDHFNAVSMNPHISFVPAWVAALAYTVQIYFDFSGYSDMAIGIAKMFGIDLPINFNSPYKATSIIDFWRRWHITLSRFLRDYLYIPLGGSRRGESRRFLNLFITMVLGGIWHGAGWTFFLWGVLHGTYLGINHLFVLLSKDRFRIPVIISRVMTMVCVVFAWIPFRASSMSATVAIWRGMVGLNGLTIPNLPGLGWITSRLHLAPQEMLFGRKDIVSLAAILVICFCFPNSQELLREFRMGLDSPGYHAISSKPSWVTIRMTPRDAVFLGVLFGLGLRAISGYSEFIYFHF